jgi:hypothetical protein
LGGEKKKSEKGLGARTPPKSLLVFDFLLQISGSSYNFVCTLKIKVQTAFIELALK